MLVLLQLTQALGDVRGLELVELHRELGHFDDAARTLQAADKEDSPSLYQISAELIEGRHTAPVRYKP
jgi:hypothetical protein